MRKGTHHTEESKAKCSLSMQFKTPLFAKLLEAHEKAEARKLAKQAPTAEK